MMDDDQLTQAFNILSIVQLARELGYVDLKEGAGQRSPFRDDKKAGSFSVQKSYFKDHANDEHRGGHIAFVQLARPGWSKKECIEFIIRSAGMEPVRQSAGAVKRLVKEKREVSFLKARHAAEDIPKLDMEEPGPMPQRIREVWNEGQAAMADYFGKLAESRGWDEPVIRALVGQNKTSLPKLPWGNGRGWAWMVEKPVFSGEKVALVPVGSHARYKVYAAKGAPAEKRWVYVPYIPTAPKSDFQHYLKEYNTKLPAYPFVLGDLSAPRLVVILEGQFDAVSFALAFGWLESGFPPGVCVFGLRGASSPNVLMAAYGGWLRRHKPFVWIFPDNDEAGRGLIRRKNEERIEAQPCFLDRVRAQGCTTVCQFLPLEGCKDFNDIWRAHQPSVDSMQKLADEAGCGDLIKG